MALFIYNIKVCWVNGYFVRYMKFNVIKFKVALLKLRRFNRLMKGKAKKKICMNISVIKLGLLHQIIMFIKKYIYVFSASKQSLIKLLTCDMSIFFTETTLN